MLPDAKPLNRCPRALVVDDHPDTAEMFARILETFGCEATPVTDPLVAQDVMEQIKPEVVFLDLNMPGLSGVDLARALRSKYGWQSLRIVAVTAYGSAEHRAATREAGFDAHVLKPVDVQLLESMLHTLFPEMRWH